MNSNSIRSIAIAAAIALATASFTAIAVEQGKTAAGGAYVTGGVTVKELVDLHAQKDKYSLWITTAAQRTGAHLSDACIRIIDARKQAVLETMMIGPWLFVELPLGRYELEVTFNGQTQKKITTIHAGDHHQALFYFDTDADVSPDWECPFKDKGGAYRSR